VNIDLSQQQQQQLQQHSVESAAFNPYGLLAVKPDITVLQRPPSVVSSSVDSSVYGVPYMAASQSHTAYILVMNT